MDIPEGTPGAGKNDGKLYEEVLSVYILLKCVWDQENKSLHLLSNLKLFGKGDDIILVINNVVYLIQMKWKRNPGNVIDLNKLLSLKHSISLPTESTSYKIVKDNKEQIKNLIGEDNIENMKFVIFANGKHHPNMQNEALKYLEPLYFTMDNQKSQTFRFKKSSTIYQKLSELECGKEYCNQLIMCTGQGEVGYIEEKSLSILKKHFNTRFSDRIYVKIQKSVKKILETKKMLNKQQFIDLLSEVIITLKHAELIDTKIDFSPTCETNMEELILNTNRLNLFCEDGFESLKCRVKHFCRESKYSGQIKLGKIIYFKSESEEELDYLKRYLLQKNKDKILVNKDKILIVEGNIPEVLTTIDNNITILSKKKLNLPNWTCQEIQTTLEHIINKDSDVKEKIINLQGDQVKFGDVIDVEKNKHIIDGLLLEQLLFDNEVVMGDPIEQQKCNYQTRRLKLINRFTDKITKLIGASQSAVIVTNSKKFIGQVETTDVNVAEQQVKTHHNIIFIQTFNKQVFATILKKYDNTHWFEEVGDRLEWRRSYGEEKLLLDHNDEDYEDVDIFEIPNRLLCVKDEPGCGKSSTLTQLALGYKKKLLKRVVIKIKLKDYYDYFHENKLQNFHDVTCFISHVFENQSSRIKFIECCLSNKNTVVLLDGFDEICPIYYEVINNLIDNLIQFSSVGKICLTSRPNIDFLFTFPYLKFEPLDEKCQIKILTNYLIADNKNESVAVDTMERFSENLINNLRQNLDKNYINLLDLPLHIEMLAYQYKDNVQEFIKTGEMPIHERVDLLSLCENFVNKKIEDYFQKILNFSRSNPSYDANLNIHKTQMKTTYMNCGLASMNLVPEEYNIEDVIEEVNNGLDKYGLISHINRSKPQFVHQLFAEYFCALYFKESLNKAANKEFIRYQLISPEMKFIKLIFDLMLSADVPLLRNIICGSADLDIGDVNVTDKAGRNMLHLSVQYNNVAMIKRVLSEKNIDKVELLKAKDDMFGWTPMEYAVWPRTIKWRTVGVLCKHGAEVNSLDMRSLFLHQKKYPYILTRCIKDDDVYFLKLIMSVNEYFVLLHYFRRNNSILATVASLGKVRLVECLLKFKQYFDLTAALNITQPNCSDKNNSLYECCSTVAKLLINAGAQEEQDNCNQPDPVYNNKKPKTVSKKPEAVNNRTIFSKKESKLLSEITLNTGVDRSNTNTLEEINKQGYQGRTVLHRAVSDTHTDPTTVDLLIKHGADVNIQDNKGETPLYDSIRSGQVAKTRILLNAGAKINTENKKLVTTLMVAVNTRNWTTIQMLVDKLNASFPSEWINREDSLGFTALHYATKKNKIKVIDLLINLGADVNKLNNNGDTPFMYAVRRVPYVSRPRAFFYYVSYTTIEEDSLIKGLALAANNRIKPIFACLVDKCKKGECLNKAIEMVKDHNAQTGNSTERPSILAAYVDGDNNTLLHLLSSHGSVRSIQILIDEGVNINGINKDGRTPLMLSVLHSNTQVVRLLAQQTDINVDVKDNDGFTALDLVISNEDNVNYCETIKAILNKYNQRGRGRDVFEQKKQF